MNFLESGPRSLVHSTTAVGRKKVVVETCDGWLPRSCPVHVGASTDAFPFAPNVVHVSADNTSSLARDGKKVHHHSCDTRWREKGHEAARIVILNAAERSRSAGASDGLDGRCAAGARAACGN